MMRQLFMAEVVGAPFDWGLSASDFAKEWARSALASHRRGAPAPAGQPIASVQFDLWPDDALDVVGRWRHPAPDRKWSGAPRPMSIPSRRLSRKELRAASARLQVVIPPRPTTRGDCVAGHRPCPWVSCRHNLFADVSENGWLKLNFPHLDPDQMVESCSLDVADRHDEGITLEELGKLFNVSLEGARQIEIDVLGELRAKLGEEEVAAMLEGERE
jgi:hypothetical protein